jgi:hypothetical protein
MQRCVRLTRKRQLAVGLGAEMWLLRAGFISGETVHLEGGARHKTS